VAVCRPLGGAGGVPPPLTGGAVAELVEVPVEEFVPVVTVGAAGVVVPVAELVLVPVEVVRVPVPVEVVRVVVPVEVVRVVVPVEVGCVLVPVEVGCVEVPVDVGCVEVPVGVVSVEVGSVVVPVAVVVEVVVVSSGVGTVVVPSGVVIVTSPPPLVAALACARMGISQIVASIASSSTSRDSCTGGRRCDPMPSCYPHERGCDCAWSRPLSGFDYAPSRALSRSSWARVARPRSASAGSAWLKLSRTVPSSGSPG